MSDADKTAAKPALNGDPAEALTKTLFSRGASAGDKKDARKLLSDIAAGSRPWEQLPSALKSAARADARTVLGEKGRDPEILTGAGYSQAIARQILRDIGRR